MQNLFSPISVASPSPPESLGNSINSYRKDFPDWQAADVVLLGLDGNADAIRNVFYHFSSHFEGLSLADLGNLQLVESAEALQECLAMLIETFLRAEKNVVFLGGDLNALVGLVLGTKAALQEVDFVQIAPTLPSTSQAFQKILPEVTSFTHLGGQLYLISASELDRADYQNVTIQRYGELHQNIIEAEPSLRDTNLLHFDLNSIRQADTLGACEKAMPNGFSAMEAAQLGKYAGGGQKTKAFLINGLAKEKDIFQQGAKLAATLLWYYLEGFTFHRENFSPHHPNLERWEVAVNASIEKIIFYHNPSEHSLRWWMEVPHDISQANSAKSVIACTQKDYELALTDEIPQRWWKAYERFNALS